MKYKFPAMKQSFKHQFWMLTVLMLMLGIANMDAQPAPANYVNPFIGTDIRSGARQGWGYGQTYPGAVVPWGMVSVSPTTALTSPSGYIHHNKWLYGFGHVHLSGTGCSDLGSVMLMPTTGEVQSRRKQYRSHYGKEHASPGYYETTLNPSGIQAQMTATTRSGISKYTFPAGSETNNILLDASFTLSGALMPTMGHVKVDSPTQIEGWTRSGGFCNGNPRPRQTQKVYFVAQFSTPADSMGTWNADGPSTNSSQSGRHVGAYLRYDNTQQQTVYVKVGISYVSAENARQNLRAEQSGWDFQGVRQQAHTQWNHELSRIEVEGGTKSQKTIFYTALYHMLLEPNVFSDANGQYLTMGHDGISSTDGYTYHSVFSLWDTYRNEHPFLTLFYPGKQSDMVKSMLAMYKDNGWLPKWELANGETYVMVGDPAVPVISDTWLNGLRDFDPDVAWQAMIHESTDTSTVNPIRPGLKEYLNKQYIPVKTEHVWGGMSTTLEYNFADYALSKFADATGHPHEASELQKRAEYYKNLYDKSSGFLRPKTADGDWYSPFNPTTKKVNQPGFVEGNAWNYLFFVPHDPHGLAELMGGPDRYVQRLQESVDKGYFVMWNEPDMAYPYLFTYFDGASWRTQKAVRQTMDDVFTPGPGGLPGNDDCGVTSAWYVFSALGFYPANPASGKYRLGSPMFDKVTIHLNQRYYDGDTFTIEAHHTSDSNIYVQSAKLNGQSYSKSYITYKDIEDGGTLEFTMGSKPNKDR